MLDNGVQIVAGVVLLSVIGIAYGGTFLLRVTRGGVPANDLQKSFFRAGHAHAGVLVILGLLVLLYMQLGDVGRPWAALASGVLIAAILMPAGFFLSVVGSDPERPNRFIGVLWAGAAALTVGLAGAGIGLITAGA
jgi:hypothetical protein